MSSLKVSPQRKNTLVKVNFSGMAKRPIATAHWRSKPANNHLKETEWKQERLFCQVFKNSSQPMSITTLVEGRYLDVNESFLSLLGYRRDEVIGRTSIELGIWKNSAQRAELVSSLERTGRVRGFETSLRGAEGQTLVWLSAADLIDLNGERCILVISNDITERRRSEETLRSVSARLIRAQEEERNRIARELHDGLNQKLALLCVDLEELSQTHHDLAVAEELNALSLRLQDASADVHGLSHRLHPSKLDHLGLLPALRSLCREMSGRRGVRIEFNSSPQCNVDEIDRELALCAYRVAQEALGNAIKHSGASRVRVQLKAQKQVLQLFITDSGKGFNIEDAKLKGRLGLISMEERLRLANGKLTIRSRPNRGTQIEARIPLPT